MKSLGLFAIVSLVMTSGCSQHKPIVVAPKTYSIATRQLPPEPPFRSTRWVRPPEVAPSRALNGQQRTPQISPIFQYKVSKLPLREAILVLAAPLKYQSYCSTQIASQTLSMDSLGTIEELASEIETLANISVVVDHQLREVRFLSR